MRTRMFIVLALSLLALAVAVAACGGDDAEETTTSPTPSADAPSDRAAPSLSSFPPEFLDCLADQGIDLESVTDVSAVIHSPEGNQCFDELHG